VRADFKALAVHGAPAMRLAPEGQTRVAQRFALGREQKDSSPVGTAEFSPLVKAQNSEAGKQF